MEVSTLRAVSLPLALLCMLPVISLAAMALVADAPVLGAFDPAIVRFLPDYIANSLMVAIGAALIALCIGGYCAWLVERYDFPLRSSLQWLLLLPLAMPAYLLAIAYAHQLDVAGVVQATLREFTGLQVGEYVFPQIRSAGGAALVLGLSLYPYVYLTARNAFGGQCQQVFEAAWLQGLAPKCWLRQLALPMARPALALGASLVLMESLADFGVASLFGVPTLTTGIYRAWYGLAQPDQAARLALLLLLIVALVLMLERYSRQFMRAREVAQEASRPLMRMRGGAGHTLLCSVPVLLGFIIPAAQYGVWGALAGEQWFDPLHWHAASWSLLLGVGVACITLLMALLFTYTLRTHSGRVQTAIIRLATLGYGIPGSVIAIAIFMPLITIDRWIAGWWQSHHGEPIGLLLTGSIGAMLLACSIRFVAVAMASTESAMLHISRRMDDAAQLAGVRGFTLFWRLHLPQLRLALFAGSFMVFADTLKELPASLLLRPFNVSTLSIRTYELASDSQLIAASVPALMLIAIGIGIGAVLLMQYVLARPLQLNTARK